MVHMPTHLVLAFMTALTAIPASAETTAAPLAPFRAEYQVLRNGKELGKATLELRALDNGTWEFVNQTKGTAGMASALGVDIVEKSIFHWRAGHPEGLSYRYAQTSTFKSRDRSVDFDWSRNSAQSRENNRTWSATLVAGAIDRNLVTLALMADVKAGTTALQYSVVDKDKLGDQRYANAGAETLSLPAGKMQAVRVERQRTDSDRRTTSWFAAERGFLPVQIEQIEKNGETLTLRLSK